MIDTRRALTVAAHGLEELDRDSRQVRASARSLGLASQASTRAAFTALTYESEQQAAIWAALLAYGIPSQREVGFLSWGGGARLGASVDFLLLDDALNPRTAACVPVQYKPPGSSPDMVVDDLLLLGLWWPSPTPRTVRRLVWSASLQNAAHVDAVLTTFAQCVTGARAAPASGRHADWNLRVATWNPTMRHNATVEVLTPSVAERVWIHEFELCEWTGDTPAEQARRDGYVEFDTQHLGLPIPT